MTLRVGPVRIYVASADHDTGMATTHTFYKTEGQLGTSYRTPIEALEHILDEQEAAEASA